MSTPSVGSVALDLVAGNTSGFFNSVQSAGNTAAKSIKGTFTSAFSLVGKLAAAALGTKAIVNFSKQCIDAASDLAEVQNVVDVTFGKSAAAIDSFAQSAPKAFGLSVLAAKQYNGTMGAMLKSMKLTDGAVLNMSTNLSALAGDMASFYNLSTDTAFEKIRSGISGETEPLKQLGINLSVANLEAYRMSQGISTAYSKMSQADQAILRYNYLLSVTADAQGDFARTSTGWANQTRILALNIETLKSSLGGLAIQALTPVLVRLNQIIEYATAAANALVKLLGGTVKTSTAATGGMGGLSSSAVQAANDITDTQKTAQKAAKKIKTSFADIDEIHILGNKDDDAASIAGAGAGTGGGAGLQTLSPLSAYDFNGTGKKLDGLLGKLKLFNGVDFKPLKTSFSLLGDSVEKFSDIVKGSLKWGFDNVLKPLAKWTIEKLLPSLVTLFANALNFLADVLIILRPGAEWLWNNFFKPIASWTGGIIITVIDGLSTALSTLDAVITGKKSVDELIPGVEGFGKAIENTKGILSRFYEGLLKPVYQSIKSKASEIWQQHLSPLLDNLKGFGRDAIQCVLDIYNNAVAPIVKFLQNTIYPIVTVVIDGIADKLKIFLSFIIDTINNMITVFRGLTQFISGVFTGDWEKAWGGIKTMFGGIWKQIANTVKTPINLIISSVETMVNCVVRGVNQVINALNRIHFTVPDWIPKCGGRSFRLGLNTINTVSLPRLEQGGWVEANNPRLAIVGDNRQEGEIISPESKIREQVELALKNAGGAIKDLQEFYSIIKSAFKDAITEVQFAFGGDWHIVIVNDSGEVTAETIISAAERKNRRDGRTVIKIGG